jgi:hypothetical protein
MSALLNRAPVALILDRLEGVRKSGAGWIAKCPAHEDRSPSLSVKEGQMGVMLRCFAGCSFSAIVEAMGLKQSDTFYESLSAPQKQHRATKAILKGCVSESYRVVCAASTTAPPLNAVDMVRLKTAITRLRAALSLQGLPGRREIERLAAYGARILAGGVLDDEDRDDLTDNVEWIAWCIADEQKPGLQARHQGAKQYA